MIAVKKNSLPTIVLLIEKLDSIYIDMVKIWENAVSFNKSRTTNEEYMWELLTHHFTLQRKPICEMGTQLSQPISTLRLETTKTIAKNNFIVNWIEKLIKNLESW